MINYIWGIGYLHGDIRYGVLRLRKTVSIDLVITTTLISHPQEMKVG